MLLSKTKLTKEQVMVCTKWKEAIDKYTWPIKAGLPFCKVWDIILKSWKETSSDTCGKEPRVTYHLSLEPYTQKKIIWIIKKPGEF